MAQNPNSGLASNPEEPQTINGYRVTGLQRSVSKGQLFGILWMPDPRGYGISGPTTWFNDGTPTDPADPPLKMDTIPFFP
jgi:hypothetical protein